MPSPLPLHVTSRINRAPQSPTQATVAMPDYQRVKAKFQLSLRTKLVLVLPTQPAWRNLPGGWQWRYTMFGAAHQSNGQSDPLSRRCSTTARRGG